MCGEGIPAKDEKWNIPFLESTMRRFVILQTSIIPSRHASQSKSPSMMYSKELSSNSRPRYQTVGFAMFIWATNYPHQPKANPNPCSLNSLIGYYGAKCHKLQDQQQGSVLFCIHLRPLIRSTLFQCPIASVPFPFVLALHKNHCNAHFTTGPLVP